MTGCLYGIGVGPGEPELMTLKAVRLIRQCSVIALPHENRESCAAYRIAAGAVAELKEKECICVSMPMTKDRAVLERSHDKAAALIAGRLSAGEDVAFLTLGDVTVYSTYLYIHERIRNLGFATEMCNGIPSFCAAAARFNRPLVSGAEELHIIPASYGIEEALKLPGVRVLMKSGRQLEKIKTLLKSGAYEVSMVENCGMEGERVYNCLEDIPDDAGYYSLLLVRDRREDI